MSPPDHPPASEKPARTKVTDSFTTPGSIQPFVWCGDEIRPQPNLEAPLAVIVYTVTKSQLTLAAISLPLLASLYLSTPLVWYILVF